MKGFQGRKRRYDLTQIPWSFVTSWYLSPLAIAHCYPMLTISDGTWAKLQRSFLSLSVQLHGDGGKKLLTLIPCNSILDLNAPWTNTSIGFISISLSHELYLFFFFEGQQEIFAS